MRIKNGKVRKLVINIAPFLGLIVLAAAFLAKAASGGLRACCACKKRLYSNSSSKRNKAFKRMANGLGYYQ